MNEWGPSVYGDPCRECGYNWTISLADAVSHVADLPFDYGGLLEGKSGREQLPELAWSVTGYVSHVADNLRIWAGRLMGVVKGAPLLVGNYNENKLADARNYKDIPIQAAMWSLTRSVDDWLRSSRPLPTPAWSWSIQTVEN